MLGPDQWLEVGVMEIYDETLQYIDIGALEVTLLSSDQKEAIIQDAMLDEEYTSAKVQIDYRLHYAHTRTRAAHSKLPVDPCATRSL
jgi:hypothetical protein